ncbi:hypothetical protein SH661x_001952 [Planctomicrobium sp. SH661]|uniref:hypothetical protein n=1 Tax=Planctomicrobium sp. SH661 TaxID=3448124 RepID=UPI003F5BD059
MSFDDEISEAMTDITAECGRTVRIQRDAITQEITAVPAATRALTAISESARILVRERDYIIAADLYRFPGDECRLPTCGDLIIDQGQRYEVVQLGDAVDCWEWSDRGETHYRIHTRQIGKAR